MTTKEIFSAYYSKAYNWLYKKLNKFNVFKGFSGQTLLRKVITVSLFGLISLIILLLFILILNILFAYSIFGMFQNWVRVHTGADVLLANAIAFLLTGVFFSINLYLLARSFLPFPQKHKGLIRFSFFGALAIFSFIAYLFSQNIYFDPQGRPLRYYLIDFNGQYKFSSSDDFDPVLGIKYKPVTQEVLRAYWASEGTTNSYAPEKQMFHNPSYQVQIKNNSKTSKYIKIASELNSYNLNILEKVTPNTMITVSLTEGSHYFVIENADLENIYFRESQEILYNQGIMGNRKRIDTNVGEQIKYICDDYDIDDEGSNYYTHNGNKIYHLYRLTTFPNNYSTLVFTDSKIEYYEGSQ